jgi:ATP-dependent DNA helicase RecG
MAENLDIASLKGVGPALQQKFAGAGIRTLDDLITYYPRRYDDFSQITPIVRIKPGPVTIEAVIKQAKGHYVRRGMHITEAVASDNTGSVRIVWFNQPYRAAALKPNQTYFISGDFGLQYRRLSIMNPSCELTGDFPVNTARIVPIYRETKGLTSIQIRKMLREAVPFIRKHPEILPNWLITDNKLLNFAEAMEAIHFPETKEQLLKGRRRLAFQEVFELILASLLVKKEIATESAVPIPFDEKVARNFVKSLSFQLTDGQRKVTWQTLQDLTKNTPMNRMVQGDVGSGKTVIAVMAALMVMQNKHQTAIMAPTELLARQHAESIANMLASLQLDSEVCLLVGGMKKEQKERAREAIASGKASILVGTHALIQDSVDMHKLALVVIDEQHRFGVEQRKKLMIKAGAMPHVLSLTATPIPRSLALTLYGELDVSILDEKPAGRQPVETKICSPNSRKQLYESIEKELAQGRQMFVVCPLIAENSSLKARSSEVVFQEISKSFKNRNVGLLHGRMKPEEKNEVMSKFLNKTFDIIVSTTVIEVGVDVPNASIMLIESAERFGLAQIHQLRGRVGRGGYKGYCYLMLSDSSAPSARLQALESSNDGFKLAELDLELRGPGAIYGTMQHGALDLRLANLTDTRLIVDARKAAEAFLNHKENLLQYPQLESRVRLLQKVTNLN